MSEIEYCNNIQNSCSNKFCETLNSEFESLKFSVNACLFKILYEKLESRSKLTTDDSRLIYLNHCEFFLLLLLKLNVYTIESI